MFCSKGRSRGKTETSKLANRCLCINCVAKRADQFRKERSSDTPLLRHQVKEWENTEKGKLLQFSIARSEQMKVQVDFCIVN